MQGWGSGRLLLHPSLGRWSGTILASPATENTNSFKVDSSLPFVPSAF